MLLKAASLQSEQLREAQSKAQAAQIHDLTKGTEGKMQDGGSGRMMLSRSWELVAKELCLETNSGRIHELAVELNRALESKRVRTNGKARFTDNNHGPIGQSSEYETVMDHAITLMGADYASLQVLVPEPGSSGKLRLLAFRGFNPDAAKFWEWVRADSKSTCGIALCSKGRVVAPDIATCDFMVGSKDQRTYLQTGIHSCQTTPLIGGRGNVVGMISTHWRAPHQPSEGDFQLFDALATRATELIESRREDLLSDDSPGS